MSKPSRLAVIFFTHIWNPTIGARVEKLLREKPQWADVFVMADQTTGRLTADDMSAGVGFFGFKHSVRARFKKGCERFPSFARATPIPAFSRSMPRIPTTPSISLSKTMWSLPATGKCSSRCSPGRKPILWRPTSLDAAISIGHCGQRCAPRLHLMLPRHCVRLCRFVDSPIGPSRSCVRSTSAAGRATLRRRCRLSSISRGCPSRILAAMDRSCLKAQSIGSTQARRNQAICRRAVLCGDLRVRLRAIDRTHYGTPSSGPMPGIGKRDPPAV